VIAWLRNVYHALAAGFAKQMAADSLRKSDLPNFRYWQRVLARHAWRT
jgi:hypothetical protein